MGESNFVHSGQKPEFSKIRSMFWPIHGYEMKKFLPMSILMFFMLFVYRMVRDLKDVLVRKYAVCGGAELLPQLKLFFVLPCAFLLVILFSFIVDRVGFNKTFYIMISAFTLFYVVFVFFLFPNRGVIHPGAETVRAMQSSWPPFFKWIVPCITNWAFTLFYIVSELWGVMAISLFFWQFAYKVTMRNEVKRFFPLYAIFGNIGISCSGIIVNFFSNFKGNISICGPVFISAVGTIAAMFMFWYINAVTLKDPKLFDPSQVREKKKKEKVSVLEGIKILFKSPYLLMICLIVVCYGVGIVFLETIWKNCTDMVFKEPNDVQRIMGTLSQVTGVFTIFASLLGQNILRKYKWKTVALIPALALGVFGGIFFGIVTYGKLVSPTIFGVEFALIAAYFGIAVDAICKGIKYCMFDATKNMAYLPLDEETKTKGQAAVEVIGGRIGKSGASAMQVFLINVLSAGSKLLEHVPVVAGLFAITAVSWVASVCNLSKKYEAKVAEQKTNQ